MRIRFAVATLTLALAAGPAYAQSKTGTTIGQFMLIEPGARAAAMGNAGVTVGGGIDAVYFNPAAAGLLEGRAVSFSHVAWLAGISHEYAVGALPIGRWGVAYGSVTALNSGEIAVRTVEQPLGTGERYTVSDVALSLGVGKPITDRFAAGVQVSYVQETIYHSSLNAVMFAVGTLYRVSDHGLRIGASLSNFGTQGAFDGRDLRILYDNDPTRYGDNGALPGQRLTDPFATPVLFRVGVGWPLRVSRNLGFAFALDASHPNDNTESLSTGAEMTLREFVSLRAGWQNLFQQDAETGLTAGAGLRSDLGDHPYHLDYAWADHGRLGDTHRVSLGFEF